MEKIYYADCLPGYGKTHWAIRCMRKNYKNKKLISVYAAPTHKLLSEVYDNLVASGVKASSIHYKREFLHSYDAMTFLKERLSMRSVQDGLLNYGDIILITHTSLWNSATLFKKFFLPKKDIFLIIDECRTLPMHRLNTTLDENEVNHFLTLFPDMKDYVSDKYYFIKMSTKKSEYLKNLFLSKNIRLYGKTSLFYNKKDQKTYASIRKVNSFYHLSLHSIFMPFSFLSGWDKVVILSSMFKASQFYNILQSFDNSLRILDVTNKIVSEYRKNIITKRFNNLYFTYLLDNNISKRKVGGYITKTKNLSFVYSEMRKACSAVVSKENKKDITVDIDSLSEYGHIPAVSQAMEKVKNVLVTKNSVPIHTLNWLCQKSLFVANKWIKNPKTHCTRTDNKLILLNINKRTSNIEDCYDALPDKIKKFSENISGDVRGLNAYKEFDVVAFFASLRLPSEVRKWFSQFCPNYDADLDTMIGGAVQTILRCSVRSSEKESKPLAIFTCRDIAMRTIQLLGSYFGKSFLEKKRLIPPRLFKINSYSCIGGVSSFFNIENHRNRMREYARQDFVKQRTKEYKNSEKTKARNLFYKESMKDLYESRTRIYFKCHYYKNTAGYLEYKLALEDITKTIKEKRKAFALEFRQRWGVDEEFTHRLLTSVNKV